MLTLREEHKQKLDSGLERLVRLQGSDPGFYILATHSFIEGLLRDIFPPAGFDEDNFYRLLDAFKIALLKKNDGRHINGLDTLKRVKEQHSVTNKIRHEFGTADAEEAKAATHHVKMFCNLAGIGSEKNLQKLSSALHAWDTKCAAEMSQELKAAYLRLANADKEKKSLLSRIADLESVEKQLVHIKEQYNVRDRQIKELQESKDRKDAKVDELRNRLNEEKKKFWNEHQELMARKKDLESTQDYLHTLKRYTVYTQTRFDYERSLTQLTKEQERVLDQISLGADFLIKGSAGTGKTLVLIKAIERAKGADAGSLGLSYGESAALLTYTNSLVKYDRYISKLLSGKNPADLIGTADGFMKERFEMIFPHSEIEYKGDIAALASRHRVSGLKDKELASEANSFIWGNDISREEYVSGGIDRRGMKRALRREQREMVWAAVEAMAAEMEASGTFCSNLAWIKFIRYAEAHPDDERLKKVDYVFIDEAQDLSAAHLKAIKMCSRKCVVMTGDSDQAIYQPGFSFVRAGIEIQGRTRILRTNFRNTVQLQGLAERYRATMPGWDPDSQPEAFRIGPPPELYTSADKKGLVEMFLQKFELFIKYLSYDPENICVIVPSKEDIGEIKKALASIGFSSVDVKDRLFDFSQQGVVRISTVHSSKGLDFPVVLLLLYKLPFAGVAYDDQTTDKISRDLIYVAISRAMDHLNVFCIENATERPIMDLMAAYKATLSGETEGKKDSVTRG